MDFQQNLFARIYQSSRFRYTQRPFGAMMRSPERSRQQRRCTRSLKGLIIIVLANGCVAPRNDPIGELSSQEPARRVAAIRLMAERGDASVVALLVDRLDDEDPAVRFAAILALQDLTDRRFDYQPGASAVERAESVKRWRQFVSNRCQTVHDQGRYDSQQE